MNIDQIPGMRKENLFARLDDQHARQLIPSNAFDLLRALKPELLEGNKRVDSLSKLVSLELAVDDPQRRDIILDALPKNKAHELEDRLGCRIEDLRTDNRLKLKVRREFLGFLGMATMPKNQAPKDNSTNGARVSVEHGLFSYQKQAAAEIENYLYHETGRAMLHLPTGAGKTRTAMSIVASHLRTRTRGLVIWLATTKELLEQAADEFVNTWTIVGDRPIQCLRFWSRQNPSLEQIDDGIIIAGLAKLHFYGRNRERLWDLGDRTSLVVFDEAHQAVAVTYNDLVETLVTRAPRTSFLGLSATPGRTWGNPELDLTVAELFYGNKVTLNFGAVNPIRKLTDEGYIAAVDFSLLNVEPGIELTNADLADITQALDIPSHIAMRIGEDTKRNLRILQRIIDLSRSHDRIIVFAPSVDSSHLLASICRAVGLEADSITSNTEPSERSHSIYRFKRPGGPPRVLVNYGVLTTGFDAPRASAAVIARPTKSLVLYSQMVGRVIRGPRAGGNERCEIITVVDTILPGFGDVAQAFMNWEDVWTT